MGEEALGSPCLRPSLAPQLFEVPFTCPDPFSLLLFKNVPSQMPLVLTTGAPLQSLIALEYAQASSSFLSLRCPSCIQGAPHRCPSCPSHTCSWSCSSATCSQKTESCAHDCQRVKRVNIKHRTGGTPCACGDFLTAYSVHTQPSCFCMKGAREFMQRVTASTLGTSWLPIYAHDVHNRQGSTQLCKPGMNRCKGLLPFHFFSVLPGLCPLVSVHVAASTVPVLLYPSQDQTLLIEFPLI